MHTSIRSYAMHCLTVLYIGGATNLGKIEAVMQTKNDPGAKKISYDFLDRVIHDLRSPLSSILNYIDLLSDPEVREDTRFIEECYPIVVRQGKQINRLLDNALITAAIDAGCFDFKMAPFSIGYLIEEIVEEMTDQTGREILYKNQAGEIICVGDALRLREMIINLIDNGIRFSSPEKPVGVSFRRSQAEGWAEISVQDQGTGFSEAEKEILFNRFGRIRNNNFYGMQGSGLGLYIAAYIVACHNGRIDVESKAGEGSVFTVSLPIDVSGEGL